MGAFTINKKRGEDYFKINSFSIPFDQSYGHISKKTKLSASTSLATPETYLAALSNSVASRIAQYPDRKQGFPREVHAPVRNLRFGSFGSAKSTQSTASPGESPADRMWTFSFIMRKYERFKDSALGSLRYVDTLKKRKEETVIEIDSEDEDCKDVSNDSSVEEVETPLHSGGKRWKGRRDTVENSQEPYFRKAEKEVRSLDSSVVTDASNAIAKVDDVERKGLLQLLADDDSGVADDDYELPQYKRLHNNSKKRDSRIAKINFDIGLTELLHQRHQLFWPPKKEEPIKKDVAEECFVPLTDEEKAELSYALSKSQRRKVLVAHANSAIDITGETLQCLRNGAWLNDEVINLYLELLKEREKREPQNFLKCHFFNTFFYKKLVGGRGGYNFQSVRRWTSQKKLGYSLLECDKIFVPIHKEVHWCLAVINMKDEKLQYLDSLGGVDKQVLNHLAKYFVDEVKDKCGKDINVSSWNMEFVRELPEQENGFDCGVFMIKYADFYSRDIGLCFKQDHMPYFRLRTAKEILKLRAD